ncbi:MAG: threonine-phosphate decarboxylase, partial [Deltaproteobacteria bacterium]|nr:threonine-phosphate decarboxylase [Deltaproteobacteria bacterium]
PHKIETACGHMAGLNLLPVSTTMAPQKTLRQVKARHFPSNLEVSGYEIHHGRTSGDNLTVIIRTENEVSGVSTEDGHIWGTYLHGIFDADPFRRWFIDRLRVRAGKSPAGRILTTYNLEQAFDKIADAVRESLNIDEIYRMMKI